MDPPRFKNRASARGREEEAVVLSIVDISGADLDGRVTHLP